MKKIFFVMLACVAFCTAQAQRFEWVKGYDSSYDNAYIKGSVTDSLGNLYILGQFHYDSDWEGGVNPLCGQLTTTNTMVIVAKISPEGELVWKKMFGNTGNNTTAQDIRLLGDTGFAVMFIDNPCSPTSDYRFWIDSVYRTSRHPLLDSLPGSAYGYNFADFSFNIYMALDFEGNITEQHILTKSYIDTEGHDLMTGSLLWLDSFWMVTFDIDVDGNIYLCRMSNDYLPTHGLYNGNLAKVQYWVDHRIVGESLVGNCPRFWYPQLLKFSPHFDTLLASRYVVQACDTVADAINDVISWIYFKCDRSTGDLYVRTFIQHLARSEENIIIDSIVNMTVRLPKNGAFRSFITVHDSNLEPYHLIEIQDSVLDSNGYSGDTWFADVNFDVDSNLVAISGVPSLRNALYTYNGTLLPTMSIDKAFIILLDKSDYHLHSVMQFPSMGSSHIYQNIGYGNLELKKNRIFLQANYKQGVSFPSGFSYVTGGSNKTGLALAMFDYQGNLIDGIDYKTYSIRHWPGPIALVDSTLYLMNLLSANATFGEHNVYVSSYFSSIAKYVDTSFMSVYQRPSPEIVDIAKQGDIAYYPNPVADILHVALDGDIVLRASAISILGQSISVDAKGNDIDVTNLPPGFYTLKISTFGNKIYNLNIIKQ